MTATIFPSTLSGKIRVPPSKSHSIRAAIFAALTDGVSTIRFPLRSGDTSSTLSAIRALGAEILQDDDDVLKIQGAGKRFASTFSDINAGNSGSLLYFLPPIIAAKGGSALIRGDKSLQSRPIGFMLDALRQFGAKCVPEVGAILRISGGIHPAAIETDGRFSQYISALMIAACIIGGKTEIHLRHPGETPYLAMTAKWLESFSAKIEHDSDWHRIKIDGKANFSPFDRAIPSDWSAAAFPIVAAAVSDSEIEVELEGNDDVQGDAAIVEILKSMGADIEVQRKDGKIIVFVRGRSKSRLENRGRLHGIPIDCSNIPDALPALSVAASFAAGTTRFSGIAVCRGKECDRVAKMREAISKIGIKSAESEDSFEIFGGEMAADSSVIDADCAKDHRIAMALSALSCGMKSAAMRIKDAECVAVSFPSFFSAMSSLGAKISLQN